MESLRQLQVTNDTKESPPCSRSCLTSPISPHLASPLPKEPQTTTSRMVSLRFFTGIRIPEALPPGNSFLHAKPLHSRAQVKRETRVTQSANYVIKILYSALTFHSVAVHGEIIQLATELTLLTALTGFSSYLICFRSN